MSGQGDEARVFLLDFEVVHLGNPVFDLAFTHMLNHLTLKAIHRPVWVEQYCTAARAFWSAYLHSIGSGIGEPQTLERDTVRQMGALLLARVDGKSPAEYITLDGEKRCAREIAREMLTGGVTSLAELHERLADVRADAHGELVEP